MYTYEKLFNVDDVDVSSLTKPRLAGSTISLVPKSMEENKGGGIIWQ